MAVNELLTSRVRKALSGAGEVVEKRMFRGITFMIKDKMCVTVGGDELLCRLNPLHHDHYVKQSGCRPMIMKGSVYKGYIYIQERNLKGQKLQQWINLALAYNKQLQ